MVEIRRELWRPSSPTNLLKAEPCGAACLGPFPTKKMTFEYLHSLSGQPFPVLSYPHNKTNHNKKRFQCSDRISCISVFVYCLLFSKGKCQVLHLRIKLCKQDMLGGDSLERTFAKKDQGVLVNNKQTISQQYCLVRRKVNSHLG